MVGLRPGSASMDEAREAGFTEADATLGEMFDVIARSDLVLLLIADAAQAELYRQIFAALRPGDDIGSVARVPARPPRSNVGGVPENVDVIGGVPEGHGAVGAPALRTGREVNGAGINTSFAVEQDVDGRATDWRWRGPWRSARRTRSRPRWRSEYQSDILW